MNSFLANLAGLALGVSQPGAARLAQPPRFGGGIASDIGLEAGAVVQAIAGSAAAMPAPDRAPKGQPANSVVQSYEPVQPAPRVPFRSDEELVRGSASGWGQVVPADIAEQSAAGRLPTPAMRASLKPPKPLERRAAAEAPRTVVPLTPTSPTPARSAPISQAALASRVTAMREPRPVVTITIDRIEVRAPREALPQPALRRPKPEPSQSLADYLEARR